MERELWSALYFVAKRLDKPWGSWRYSASDVLMVHFWAVVHDRPESWAAEARNWPAELWPKPLPSQSTLSRRMRKADAVQLMGVWTDPRDRFAIYLLRFGDDQEAFSAPAS